MTDKPEIHIFNPYWACNYDELITFYPRYYREVFEMDAILRAHGGLADGIQDGIEKMFANCFVETADESTIALLEKFLGLSLQKKKPLDERRRMILSYFAGSGRLSAETLKEMIRAYTGAEVEIRFEPCDDEGNNMLYIDFQRGESPTLYMSDINFLLEKKIPAHIAWQSAVANRYPVVIGVRRTHYKCGYELCGTLPDTAMLGALAAFATVVQAKIKSRKTAYQQAADAVQFAGEYPENTTLADVNKSYVGAGMTATEYGASYVYCGTRYTQS